MAIIGAITPTIKNGDVEDATVVMAMLTFIQAQVNNNGAPATTGSAVLKGDGSGGTTTAVAGTDYVSPAQISTIYTTGGTSTAYTLTPTPAVAAYIAGQSFFVNFNQSSGASPTLAINGVATPPTLVKQNTDGTFTSIAAGDIPSGLRSRVTLISTTQALVESCPRALGEGQTWQDVSGSRAFNTNYTNTTGRPIAVSASGFPSVGGVYTFQLVVAGVTTVRVQNVAPATPNNLIQSVSGVVPAGAVYQVSSTGSGAMSLSTWAELR